MDWNAQIKRDLRALDGIVVILLSLAALAERAADAPYPIRCVVFWFIRQAEAVATEFVAGSAARAKWLAARIAVGDRSSPVGETNLASSLGSLACAVAAQVAQLRRLTFLHRRHRIAGKSLAPRHGVPGAFGMTVPQVRPTDTS